MAKVSVEPRTLPTRLFCLPKEVCITILPLKHVVYNYTGKSSTYLLIYSQCSIQSDANEKLDLVSHLLKFLHGRSIAPCVTASISLLIADSVPDTLASSLPHAKGGFAFAAPSH